MKSILRLNEISRILMKYGLGELLKLSHLSLSHELNETTAAVRFKRMLEELGPTFVKFGQLLSTQEAVLPSSFITELKKLQDQVEPFGFEEVKKQIEKSFGRKLEDIFDDFEPLPEASASLGQVHKAKLKSGEFVAVKVKRPGIEQVIDSDMFILTRLGQMINDRVKELFHFEILPLIKEFEKTIKRELNYTIEAHFIEVFKKNLARFKNVYVPSVWWDYTTYDILTMEYIFGYKATDKQKLIEKGFNLEKLAVEGAKVFWYQIFDAGLFHADPHPGNIIIMKDSRICYIDYGMVGRIDEEDKINLIDMLLGFIEKDTDRVFYAIENFTVSEGNPESLKNDISELIELYHSVPLQRLNLSNMIKDIFSVLRRNGIIIKKASSRLMRAIIIADGVGRDFYPDFNFVEVAKPYFRRFAKKYYSLGSVVKLLLKPHSGYLLGIKKLPIIFKNTLESMESGRINVEIHIEDLDKLINTVRYVSRQIGISLIISSVILTMGLLVSNHSGPTLLGIPVVLIISIVVIVLLGIGIWKADKKMDE